MLYRIIINPVAKPRMTRSDKWKERKCTSKFWGFKDELILKCNKAGLKELPGCIESLDFFIEMPKSWSEKKRREMDMKPHQVKPDIDNILKGVQDCLCKKDQHIYHIGRLSKTWAYEGKIEIDLFEPKFYNPI